MVLLSPRTMSCLHFFATLTAITLALMHTVQAQNRTDRLSAHPGVGPKSASKMMEDIRRRLDSMRGSGLPPAIKGSRRNNGINAEVEPNRFIRGETGDGTARSKRSGHANVKTRQWFGSVQNTANTYQRPTYTNPQYPYNYQALYNPSYDRNGAYNPVNPIPNPYLGNIYNNPAPGSYRSPYPYNNYNVAPAPAPTTAKPIFSNMRPIGDTLGDRNRQSAQDSSYGQLMSSLMGSSYWSKTSVGDKQGVTPALTETTLPPQTTQNLNSQINANFFNADGSINRHRPGMIKMPEEDDTVRDRNNVNSAFDLFLGSISKNYFTDTQSNRDRANDDDKPPAPKIPQAVVVTEEDSKIETESETETGTEEEEKDIPMYDKPYIDIPDEFLTTNYTERPNATETDVVEVETAERSAFSDPEPMIESAHKVFDDDGKLFQGEVYSDILDLDTSKLASINGLKAGEENKRLRRQTNVDAARNNACQSTSGFASCQFYQSCYASTDQQCRSRESFIGDDYSSVCYDLQSVARESQSDILQDFVNELATCVDQALLEIMGYGSCDDVSEQLTRALLVEGEQNCITRAQSNFCRVLESPTARYNLAMLFAEPKGREVFLLELLVSLGTQTDLCTGPGANIFLLDLLSQVMRSDTTYTLPGGQPMPTFEP